LLKSFFEFVACCVYFLYQVGILVKCAGLFKFLKILIRVIGRSC
jgi:hypothetical protein